MTKRAYPRLKRRVNCDVTVEGRRHMGVILDLSPRGFFVQTQAAPAVGSTVVVTLRAEHAFELEARVANRRATPPRFASVARGGIGCHVPQPPEAYFQLLQNLSGA